MGAGLGGIADHRVLIDTGQPRGLADATAVVPVLKDGQGLGMRQAGAEQGGAGAFGETLLTGATGEHPAAVPAIAKRHAEVVVAAEAIGGAVGVLAAESTAVVHEQGLGMGFSKSISAGNNRNTAFS
jgi:hypothetical protein